MDLLVESVSPIPGSTGLYLETPLQVTFDRLVDEATITPGSFVVTRLVPVDVNHFLEKEAITANTIVPGEISCATVGIKTRATFQTAVPLDPTCTYKVILSKDITALDGSILKSIYSWNFSTGSGDIVSPPPAQSGIAPNPYLFTPVVLPTAGPRLLVTEVDPELRSSNLAPDIQAITVTCNYPLDPDLFPSNYWKLYAEPVDGNAEMNPAPVLDPIAAVEDNQIFFTWDEDLKQNNRVVLELKNLYALDGTRLVEPYQYYFTTTYSPFYSSPIMVRARIGNYIKKVPDDTINLLIYEASLEADFLTPIGTVDPLLTKYYNYYLRRFAQVSACLRCLPNTEELLFQRKSKVLGDMEISWEQSKALVDLVNDLKRDQMDCADNISALVMFPIKPQMAVKGSLDPDRPEVGRDYVNAPWSPPAINNEARSGVNRRKHGYFSNWPSSRSARKWWTTS